MGCIFVNASVVPSSNFVDFIQCASMINLLRPKRQSSGLEVEANLTFED